jgi:hypothetical protein
VLAEDGRDTADGNKAGRIFAWSQGTSEAEEVAESGRGATVC